MRPSNAAITSLLAALLPVCRRQVRRLALRRAVIALLGAACVVLVAGLCRIVLNWDVSEITCAALLILAPLATAILVWLLRAEPLESAAKLIDQHYGLQDRTLTALEFAKSEAPSDFQRLQITDAMKRLSDLDPRAVVPFEWPRLTRLAAVLCIACLGLLVWPLSPLPVIAEAVSHPGVDAAVEAIAEEIEELKELAEQVADKQPEIKTLADELAEQLKVMKVPGTEPRKALETISEMQSKLSDQLKELNPAAVDAQMKNLSEALSSADQFKPTAAEMQKGDYRKAAEELEKLKGTELDRKEARTTKEKLDESAKSMDEAGMKELSEAVKQLADAVKENDAAKLDEATKELANETREQGVRKQIGQKLAMKLGRLGELKSLAQSGDREGNRNSMQKGKNQKSERSSQTFGQGEHGKLDGAKSELSTTRQFQQLQGTLGEGDSEKETTQGEQSEETAKRKVRATFGKYQKLSDAVLESEPIPLGQRQMIRKYFELIRPEPADEPTESSK